MSVESVQTILAQRAALTRKLADLDEALASALEATQKTQPADNKVLSLEEAAAFMGEPVSTFRRRTEYARALISRPAERRKRYSSRVLEEIKQNRLAANTAMH